MILSCALLPRVSQSMVLLLVVNHELLREISRIDFTTREITCTVTFGGGGEAEDGGGGGDFRSFKLSETKRHSSFDNHWFFRLCFMRELIANYWRHIIQHCR